jgi:hypothetical protein
MGDATWVSTPCANSAIFVHGKRLYLVVRNVDDGRTHFAVQALELERMSTRSLASRLLSGSSRSSAWAPTLWRAR